MHHGLLAVGGEFGGRRVARTDDSAIDDVGAKPASEEAPEGRWRPYTYAEIIGRDKVSLDLFWLRDESLEDSANLPDPHLLAQEIADDLRSALGQTEDVLGDLEARTGKVRNGENG